MVRLARIVVPNFAHHVTDPDDPAFGALRRAEGIGRPPATAAFVADLERRLKRPIARRAPGRKPRQPDPQQTKLL